MKVVSNIRFIFCLVSFCAMSRFAEIQFGFMQSMGFNLLLARKLNLPDSF
jgi:hypothetical protein